MSFLSTIFRHFRLPCMVCLLFSAIMAENAFSAVSVLDTYYSPRNKERPKRKSTTYIILHTTEGSATGAAAKLSKNGEAHYMIDKSGRTYRIIDRRRVAYHCGLSMWDGATSLDNCSIGIEMVGEHDKSLTSAQVNALKKLLAELKRIYAVPDSRILTHSMVAYGAPNQWHKKNHRGRKRCGMLMAKDSVRKSLGIYSRPATDPDVKAKRLVVADPELFAILYPKKTAAPKTSTAAKAKLSTTAKSSPPKPSAAAKTPTSKPSATAGTEKSPGGSPSQSPTSEGLPKLATSGTDDVERTTDWNAPTTIYVLKGGKCVEGSKLTPEALGAMDKDTRIAYNSRIAGTISAKRPPIMVCGSAWNKKTTLYASPSGSVIRGDAVDPSRLPSGTVVIVAVE